LREDLGLKLAGLKVLLLGTGGAGQVAALRLAMEGVAELFLVEYVIAKAEAVAEEIRKRYPQVKVAVGFPKGEVDLLLNATPIGLRTASACCCIRARRRLKSGRARPRRLT
jgi:shikimate dehydrogenase